MTVIWMNLLEKMKKVVVIKYHQVQEAEAITAQIFPQEQNVLVKIKNFHLHFFDETTH